MYLPLFYVWWRCFARIFIVSIPTAVILETFLFSNFYTNNIFVESNVLVIPMVDSIQDTEINGKNSFLLITQKR